ncbi:hypothetical protein D9758_010379 [Tetrapyrgos nigripes]|uniref:Heterokaryon incompatibility domain-containing protein n=1 Tax=Tetrapyrgos nigripes TaxID=182062 RepID=A0A8H5CZ90_9AGAR|nr:hypothetical protein D9758_010379 [Tetrapyrgos nigripes]
MRLLNTNTLRVQEFFTKIPRYVILSHTWEDEEITFQDIQNLATLADTCNGQQVIFDDIQALFHPAQPRKGYKKVVQACVRARNNAFDWIWIDSCCINKESSAELSEAINSMYQYYEDAVVCYVYLFDVSAKYHPRNPKSNFKRSRWFERGWTLQELLAPEYIVFFDKDWTKIGTRWSLRDVISVVTNIPIDVLEGRPIDKYSVAQKMSWAAFRETTRPEDESYCLMGIFSVSMPPIYGEGGEKAFMRLQQEIIRVSDDRSIFAWISEQGGERGLLARSPWEFRYSGQVRASSTDAIIGNSPSSYSFNNNGLHIHLPLEIHDSPSDVFLASLLCQTNDGSYVSVYLQRTTGGYYVRHNSGRAVLRSTSPPLDDVRELTVREGPIPRIIHTTGEKVVSQNHVNLLPSARHFVCSRLPPGASISTEFSVEFKTSQWQSTDLTYEYPSKHEAFTLSAAERVRDGWTFHTRLSYFLRIGGEDVNSIVGYRWYDDFDINRDYHPRADYMLGSLPNSCFVSACLEMRGDEKNLVEVDYFSPQDSQSEGVATTVGPELGFWVPFTVGSYELQVRRTCCLVDEWAEFTTPVVVPDSDFLVLEYTMPMVEEVEYFPEEIKRKGNELEADQRDKLKGEEGPTTFYVAVGCHQSVPWTYITFEGKSTRDVQADLQSRKEDLYGQTSATDAMSHRKLRVWIGPGTHLDEAFHMLRFEWVRDDDDAVDGEMEEKEKEEQESMVID